MQRKSFLTALLALPFIRDIAPKESKWKDASKAKRGAKLIWGTDKYKDYKIASLDRRVWKIEDIKAGLYVTRAYQIREVGNIASRAFQVGYCLSFGRLVSGNGFGTYRLNESDAMYTLNSVADGWLHGDHSEEKWGKYQPFMGYTKKAMVEYFNEDKFGYRPVTKGEMHAIIDKLDKNFIL